MHRMETRSLQTSIVASLGVIVILVAACSGEADTTTHGDPATATTTTTVATTTTAAATTAPTTTAAAVSQELHLTFDGERCIYEGPTEADRAESFALTFVNDSDLYAFGMVRWVPPDHVEEVIPTVGTDFPFGGKAVGGEEQTFEAFYAEVPSGGEQVLTGLSVAAPGTYVLDCVSAEGATMLHIWRPVAIEFS